MDFVKVDPGTTNNSFAVVDPADSSGSSEARDAPMRMIRRSFSCEIVTDKSEPFRRLKRTTSAPQLLPPPSLFVRKKWLEKQSGDSTDLLKLKSRDVISANIEEVSAIQPLGAPNQNPTLVEIEQDHTDDV
mmetsp:Transcript_55355/g.145988  ORF Transcript_55355/g.145988 Transcript_55355/m.145988 type:complete len:131 (-) Transcript_55355:114-506(-)|eukprot:CAMPEP_0113711244 /NCGR_PEP_ID=MMETSP0038_2-20120614/30645_1 /TAXON_ID=2898 /ORGANISM="Cryptomonas paramecium" /LENGTH=130 /DNA_ID=CAMNT_0000637471 /DNA_START=1 /DNA_END=393 /DNA_ORIENTATION=+ /assembly_acc=CAM_ASM_000170